MVGVAVKVTLVPEQMLVADATMLTEGITVGVTVIFTALLVAATGKAQAREEVITTVTILPFARLAF